MTDPERYIRTHAAEFDTQDPATGHEERFLARLDATRVQPAAPSRPARRAPWTTWQARVLFPALALAALAAAVLLIRPGDPFRAAGNDPEAIYLAYMDQVAGLYGALPGSDSARRDADLQAITEEADPLFAQLPEELGSRQRSRILKAYYGELLERARQINKQR